MLLIGYRNQEPLPVQQAHLPLTAALLPLQNEVPDGGRCRLNIALSDWHLWQRFPTMGEPMQLFADGLPIATLYFDFIKIDEGQVVLHALSALGQLKRMLDRPLREMALYPDNVPFLGAGDGTHCLGAYVNGDLADQGFTFPWVLYNQMPDAGASPLVPVIQRLTLDLVPPAFSLRYLCEHMLAAADWPLKDRAPLDQLTDLVELYRGSKPFRFNWARLYRATLTVAAGGDEITALFPVLSELTGLPAFQRQWRYQCRQSTRYVAAATLSVTNTGAGTLSGDVVLAALFPAVADQLAAQQQSLSVAPGATQTVTLTLDLFMAEGQELDLTLVSASGDFTDWELTLEWEVTLPDEAEFLPLNQQLPDVTAWQLLADLRRTFGWVLHAALGQTLLQPYGDWVARRTETGQVPLTTRSWTPPVNPTVAYLPDVRDVWQPPNAKVAAVTLPFAITQSRSLLVMPVGATQPLSLPVPAMQTEAAVRQPLNQGTALYSFQRRWLAIGEIYSDDGLPVPFPLEGVGTPLVQLTLPDLLSLTSLQALSRGPLPGATAISVTVPLKAAQLHRWLQGHSLWAGPFLITQLIVREDSVTLAG